MNHSPNFVVVNGRKRGGQRSRIRRGRWNRVFRRSKQRLRRRRDVHKASRLSEFKDVEPIRAPDIKLKKKFELHVTMVCVVDGPDCP